MALASEIWVPDTIEREQGGIERPRIAIAGISIESSTFSAHRSGDEAFTMWRGEDLLSGLNPFLAPGHPYRDAAEWIPVARGRSLPGGTVVRATYERMADEIVEGLRAAGQLDALWYDIHGAMSVEGLEDAEGDLIGRIREVVGDEVLIAASMDLHGNVSRQLATQVDMLTCYRMAPHEDAPNTRKRLVRSLLNRLHGRFGSDVEARRPYKAWVQIPVLLPGEKTSTRLEPATSIYNEVPKIEAMDAVIDASYWIGYAWADEPRCQAAVVVYGDDAELCRREAERVAAMIWDRHEEFQFVAPADSLEMCLQHALAEGAARPYFISDSGDNPTAGGSGDVTWTAHQLLAHPVRTSGLTVIHASMFDPAAVAACVAAGVGGHVSLDVGAGVDDTTAGPVPLAGEVFSITEGDPVAGTIAVIKVDSLHFVVTERRKPYHHESDFTELGLDPRHADIVLVKIGYLEPELYTMAADWMMALTPGGVDQDLIRLGHHRIERPMFPFDPDMGRPALQAEVLRGR
ncbi:M81 family metallopeptidase [Aestuariimicrobium kwangyangense]|uniref:M81 family metallopeptidase n=1 Tax=Aestuariimicrobium kwangyangense TaxID=396389 RepID=UPI0003B3F9F2|nr:M81 family metallopeptidase [Aestuariimicrobium kwangyangense]